MNYTAEEVSQYVREEDVKFIRLAFCDVYGRQKNISVMPDELPRAFERGIPFYPAAVPGYEGEGSLMLHPDPGTLSVLPWRLSEFISRLLPEKTSSGKCKGGGSGSIAFLL